MHSSVAAPLHYVTQHANTRSKLKREGDEKARRDVSTKQVYSVQNPKCGFR